MSKVIGKGDVGIVYCPPLEGFPPFQTDQPHDFVSKVFERHEDPEAASNELLAANLLREKLGEEVASSFLLLPIHSYTTREGDYAIIYRYGGNHIYKYKKLSFKHAVLVALINLLPSIVQMNAAGICHGDVFAANILFNEHEKKCYLIDLEKMAQFEDILADEEARLKSNNRSSLFTKKWVNAIYNRDVWGLARTVFGFLDSIGSGNAVLEEQCTQKKCLPASEYAAIVKDVFETLLLHYEPGKFANLNKGVAVRNKHRLKGGIAEAVVH